MSIEVKNFEADVLKKSFEIPVVADFWAEWCGPCRILGPVLERLAGEGKGEWVLAKVDTEAMPEIAERFGIRGIPAVKLFVDGKATAEFVGALPDFQIRLWLKKSLPDKFRHEIQSAQHLAEKGKESEARETLKSIVRQEPGNEQARSELARLVLFEDPARAEELVQPIEVGDHLELAEAIRTVAHLASFVSNGGSLPEGTSSMLYGEASKALLKEEYERALKNFIEIIRNDRYYDDDGSRKACIAIFKLLGEDHSLTQQYRRAFSTALY